MSGMLEVGDKVFAKRSNSTVLVKSLIGGGGQGEVYKVELNGAEAALKWYFPHTATDHQREVISQLLDMSPPSDRFLWPLDFALPVGSGVGFGYLMKLREPRFKNLIDLGTGKVELDFRQRVTLGLKLADSFYQLHSAGLCYCDISWGNAFFDPDTCDILICDNDNVARNRSSYIAVNGTPNFMAPEIVRQDEGVRPSRQTDLFSLSVLLFYLFCLSHPFEGRRKLKIRIWDSAAQSLLFGKEPVFIFDPDDKSNEAVSAAEDSYEECGAPAIAYWGIYPQILKDVFVKAFTQGVKDPQNGRVQEGEWRRILSQVRDSIVYCRCGRQNFVDVDNKGSARGGYCWGNNCQKQIGPQFRIKFPSGFLALPYDGAVYRHHVEPGMDFDFNSIWGAVNQHPTDPSIWGLKNCTHGKWVITTNKGEVKDVEPGKSVKLEAGVRISFGKVVGEIVFC